MKQKLFSILIAPALFCLAAISTGCSYTPDPYVRDARVGGVAIGAGLGAIVGHNSGGLSTGEGAVAGAVIGGILGDVIGKSNSAYYRRSDYRDSRYYRFDR